MFKKIIDTITDSLRVKNNEIIGNIYNLEKKLNGEIPITRLELLVLVSSWGRTSIFYTNIKDDKVLIKEKNKGKSFDLSKLDTSEITDMSSIFRHSNFNNIHSSNGVGLHNDIHSTNGIGLHNGDISNWNTSNVTDMSYMFCGAEKFNQVVNFNTSKVTNMEWMFYNAETFNNIHSLPISISQMESDYMNGVGLHNQPLNFNTSKVTNMERMFGYAERFNQPLNWDTSNVTNMKEMFYNARDFNQKLNFNTSKVTNMEWMFCGAEKFNQALNFDTSKVTNMELMFYNAIEFNQPINFDISNIITMERMFCDADAFLDKYNSGKALADYTHKIKDWINNNRDIMNEIDLKDKYGDEIDDFFSNITDIYSTNRIGLHENLLTECNKLCL